MDDPLTAPGLSGWMSPLSERPSRIWRALERIEGELFAVERALEQIDEGVYEGFEGLPEPERARR